MNRELLEKAKEIEEAIYSLEKIEDSDNKVVSFSSCIVRGFGFISDVKLPEEMNGDIMELVRKYKMYYEKQLEEL